MKRRLALMTLALFSLFACSEPAKETQNTTPAAAPAEAAPKVRFKTNMGEFVIELDAAKAPVTVANFLSYVNKKHYDGTVFHRVIEGFMIQGGGFALTDGKLVEKEVGAGILNESQNGLKNDRGTVAMARTNDPNSATAQFFVNVTDNDMLNYPSNNGYAVFGKVVEGMTVVDKIRAVPTGTAPLNMKHPTTGEEIQMPSQDVPQERVVILSATAE